MRGPAITFVVLVAGIASCSSYGETKSDKEAPSSIDGGSSGIAIMDGGGDGIVGNDASPSGDQDANATDAGRHVPTIVQAASGLLAPTAPDQLSVTFDRSVTPGNTVLLFVGTWGAKVKVARLGNEVLDAIASDGQFPTQTTMLKVVPAGTAAAEIDVELDSPGGAPLALAVEVTNAAAHAQRSSNGTGNVALDVIGQPPALAIANVVGNGAAPTGPLNAQPLGMSSNDSGQTMVSAWKLVTDLTSPKIRWTSNDTFPWQAMVIAFQPAL